MRKMLSAFLEGKFIEIDLPYYALIFANCEKTAIASYVHEILENKDVDYEVIEETLNVLTKEEAWERFLKAQNPSISFDSQQAFKHIKNGEIIIYDEELIERWTKSN